MGRRDLRRRSGGSRILRQACVGARARRGGAARWSDHQPTRAQPGPADATTPASPADHRAADGHQARKPGERAHLDSRDATFCGRSRGLFLSESVISGASTLGTVCAIACGERQYNAGRSNSSIKHARQERRGWGSSAAKAAALTGTDREAAAGLRGTESARGAGTFGQRVARTAVS
jgi:hypothetical protein